MAGKRGIVYVCPEAECDWKGERGFTLAHYAKKHCTAETAPFGCVPCKFATDIYASLERHRDSNKHKSLIKGDDDKNDIRRNANEDEITKKFSKLSPEESNNHWRQRKEKSSTPGPVEVKKTTPGPVEVKKTTKGPVEVKKTTKGPVEVKKTTKGPVEEKKTTKSSPSKPVQETPKAKILKEPTTSKIVKDPSPPAAKKLDKAAEELAMAVASITTPKAPETERNKRDQSVESVSSASSSASSSSTSSSSPEPMRRVVITNAHKMKRGRSQSKSPSTKRARKSSSTEPDYQDWKRQQSTFDIIETGLSQHEEQNNPTSDDPTTSDMMTAIKDIKDSCQDNPAVLATGIYNLSQQMRTQTNETIKLNSKMDLIAESLVGIRKLMGTMVAHHSEDRKEMMTIRQAMCQQQNSTIDYTKAINSLATSVKTMAPKMEAMMGCVTTALTTFAAAQTAALKPQNQTNLAPLSAIDVPRQKQATEPNESRPIIGDRCP